MSGRGSEGSMSADVMSGQQVQHERRHHVGSSECSMSTDVMSGQQVWHECQRHVRSASVA